MGAALARRASAARLELEAICQRLEDSRARLQETRMQLGISRPARERLHDSQLARLLARLETMPVIEQAKGVLIAQTGCDAEQAFAMLRSASQRANIPVRDLAMEIVGHASGQLPAPRAQGVS
jgi:AmiR/NasT family two-component response regulator